MPFLDIFSKTEHKEKQKIKIIADNREKNSLVISELIKNNNLVELKQLEIGDYIIGDLAIERKTISDFKNSIIDKRLFSQLINLKQYPEQLLILEGENNENMYSGKIHENAVRGFLLSIALKLKIPIIKTINEKDTSIYLSLLSDKKRNHKEYSLRPSKKSLSEKEQIQFILEGFPNIGPTRANKLIEKFKSLKEIANASIQELNNVIGKDADYFYNMLNQEFES